jgi:YD repeat-containing protein
MVKGFGVNLSIRPFLLKRTVFLLFVSFFLLSLTGNEFNFLHQSDAERARLKGKVKRLSATEYKVSDTADISHYKPTASTEYLYNTDGNLTSRVQYVRDDTMWTTTTYGYNGKQRAWQAYGINDTIFYTYDRRGNLTEALWPPGSLYRREVYIYDQHDLLIGQLRIEDNGDTTYRVEQRNDTLKHKVRRIVEHHVDTIVYRHVYVYTKGRLTLDSSWTKDGRASFNTTAYTYDKQGNCTEERRYPGGRQIYVEVTRSTYVYDKQGNWTKLVRHREGGPFEVIFRAIEYY